MAWAYFGTWLFGMRTFRLRYFSAPWTFQHLGPYGTALGHFGTRIFWHMDILAQRHLCWIVCAKMFRLLCTVPKCTCAKTSMCRNILMPKFPSAVTSMVLKYTHVEMFLCWNVSCGDVRCRNKPKPNWWNIKTIFSQKYISLCGHPLKILPNKFHYKAEFCHKNCHSMFLPITISSMPVLSWDHKAST